MKDYAKFSKSSKPRPIYQVIWVICILVSLSGLIYLGKDLLGSSQLAKELNPSKLTEKIKALKTPLKKATSKNETTPKKTEIQSSSKPKFDFYTLLPQMKMSSTVEESPAIQKPKPKSNPNNEYFVLQIASLQNPNAAEDLINRLNLLGFETQTELVQKNGVSWIRISSKAYSSFQEAEQAQERLEQHHISSLLLKTKK